MRILVDANHLVRGLLFRGVANLKDQRKKQPGRPNRPHFDYPINSEEKIEQFLADETRIAKHAFHPFLFFEIKTRRFRKDPANKKRYTIDEKRRPIRVAAHKDTYIFNHYNNLLSLAYERKISGGKIDDCVLAYRKGKGCNIDFANDAFKRISDMGECAVLAADLSDFYETIGHDHLKKVWANLLGVERLPKDHFQVFKAITQYAVVDANQLKKVLKIPKKSKLPKPIFSSPRKYREILKTKNAGGKNLIIRNNHSYGIPQGSPVSALLSNIAMMDFDHEMANFAEECGGLYRRYSDDILLAIPQSMYETANKFLKQALEKVPGPIKENASKRMVSLFNAQGLLVSGPQKLSDTEVQSRILQYLGFLFDGNNVTIRSQTLARYWRKVTRGIRAAKRRAAKNKLDSRVRKRKIYRRFSHLGKMNLHSYKRNSIHKMSFEGIRNQFSNNWKNLQKEIEGPIKRPKRPSR